MRSIHVYKNKDKFYRGENEAFYLHGGSIIDRDSKVTEISKSDVILLLQEEITLYKEWLNDSIKNNQVEREASIREGLDELNAILNELQHDLKNDDAIDRKSNAMKYLFEIDRDWLFSKFYYDELHDCFFEEKYHYEYLDTGTICDGMFPIDDDELWKRIIESNNETGKIEFRKIRNNT